MTFLSVTANIINRCYSTYYAYNTTINEVCEVVSKIWLDDSWNQYGN